MVRQKYVSASIPEDLAGRVDEIIKGGKWGFRTRAELINEAVRNLIIQLKSVDEK